MSLWGNDSATGAPKYTAGDSAAAAGSTIVSVTAADAATPENIAAGLTTPGWVRHTTYTDSSGSVRNKSEVLVAMPSIVEAAPAAPSITSVTVAPVIGTAGSTATFNAIVVKTGAGALTYQWQDSDGVDIVGATSDALTVDVDDYAAVPDVTFAVSVTIAGGNTVVSAPATLTIE